MDYRLAFDDVAWEPALGGTARMKRLARGNKAFRLLELTPASEHPDWCEVGHAGLVVEGAFDIEFEAQTVRYEEGDALFIPSGHDHRHRPRAASERVLLFLIDDEA